MSKKVSETVTILDSQNTNTSSTSLSHADAGLQGLISVDQRMDDISDSVDPDHVYHYVNTLDTADLSSTDPDQGPQDTVNNATVEMETVEGIPRAKDDEDEVDRDINDYDSDSKQTYVIDLFTDYPTDPALFENVAITPSLLRAMIEAGPCQPGFDDNRYEFVSDISGFKFKPNWYMKETKSGLVKRNWLVFSHRSQKMFCFCCMLLADKKNVRTSYSDVWAKPSLGITRFRKGLEKIKKHEKSILHRQAENDLLLLKIRLSKDVTVIQKLVESEKSKLNKIEGLSND